MPKKEYDDNRYLEWREEIQKLLSEFINTQGNTKNSLQNELEDMLDNLEEEE